MRNDPVISIEWRDEGCRYWRSCLNCVFVRCLEEWSSPEQGIAAQRGAVLRRLHRAGYPVAWLAQEFHVSKRAVQRAVAGVEEEEDAA